MDFEKLSQSLLDELALNHVGMATAKHVVALLFFVGGGGGVLDVPCLFRKAPAAFDGDLPGVFASENAAEDHLAPPGIPAPANVGRPPKF